MFLQQIALLACLISGVDIPPPPPSSSSSEDGVSDREEELEEASTKARVPQVASSPSKEVFTGVDSKGKHSVGIPPSRPSSAARKYRYNAQKTCPQIRRISNETTASPECLPESDAPTCSFFVDTEPTKPSAHRSASDAVLFDRTAAWGGAPPGADDELIVYVAPHP
ncbi:hypothetical protein DEU56DRAFT_985368 [Suillus clintonianus]|uniref:uncharacterized protein n=1 Tax=Suillus clintonianus TaxID=1904413 RepID=UPI001B85ED8D|nr:uncharacterized protein DEU56DRAFT_985368 [Suillus clintonianus]KAG2111116.1 hypothetical protein DEU56DRAFT_985368 [Suillus clintonianus]